MPGSSILQPMVMVKVDVLGGLTTVDLTIVVAKLIKCFFGVSCLKLDLSQALNRWMLTYSKAK